MPFLIRSSLISLGAAVLLVALVGAGCAKGPLWRTGYLAPWALKRWSDEERYAATLFSKRDDLRAIVRTAAKGSAAEREHAAQRLVEVIETNPVRLLRIEAVRLLGQLDSPTAEAGLARAAQDPSSEVRLAAVHACSDQANAACLQVLQQILGGDTDIDVRLAAARQLQHFDDPGAIRALAVALDDTNPALQVRAADSLQKVTGESFGRDIEAWRQYAQSRIPAPSVETQRAEQPASAVELR
jgi:HEAT repeat protein